MLWTKPVYVYILDMFLMYDISARGVVSVASGWLSGLTNFPALVLILQATLYNQRRLKKRIGFDRAEALATVIGTLVLEGNMI